MRKPIGGIIHSYQKFDPVEFPSPTTPPPDLVSSAFEHALMYGSFRELTDEELARSVHLDPSQIANLGPSIEHLRQLLLQRRAKILATYETQSVTRQASAQVKRSSQGVKAPKDLEKQFRRAVAQQQAYDLEHLWYIAGDDRGDFARGLVQVIAAINDNLQIQELASNYEFTGSTPVSIAEGLDIKAELERIDELLRQLDEAAKTAQIAVIDMEMLSEFTQPGDLGDLEQVRQQVEEMVRELAARQGLDRDGSGYRLTPKAYKLFQGQLLSRIFSDLQASRSARHPQAVEGDGAVEMQQTKPYEFGDSVANIDLPQTVINALLRQQAQQSQSAEQAQQSQHGGSGQSRLRLHSDDIEVHRTRNHPKCATCVIMDMSGSMRYDGQYMNVKRMALALQGLITSEFPGDFLRFIEMYTFAKMCHASELINLMPKPVTIHDPWVRLRADMSRDDLTESQIHPHFTNIQRSLQLARQNLVTSDTPNRQIILITDGLPTAHFEDQFLYMLYPPDPQTEQATMREAQMCQREGITINLFLIPSWSQSQEDIRFAYSMAEATKGRVIFTSGKDLDRFVIWDYVNQRRDILG